MNPVHDTLEIVGIDDRIGAIVPVAARRPKLGVIPRAIRSCTSGSPTPSRPMTATLPAVAGRSEGRSSSLAPPRRNRSSQPTPRTSASDLFLRDPNHLGDRCDARADGAPAVVTQRAHPLLHRRVLY